MVRRVVFVPAAEFASPVPTEAQEIPLDRNDFAPATALGEPESVTSVTVAVTRSDIRRAPYPQRIRATNWRVPLLLGAV